MALQAYTTSRNPAQKISTGSPVLKLLVPDGPWVIFAKINLDNDDTVSVARVTARLEAKGQHDVGMVRLAPSGASKLDNAMVALNIVAEWNGNSSGPTNVIELFCDVQGSTNVSFRAARITAMRVDDLEIVKPAP